MAPRVKRLAGQGAQNIGAFTADKVQAANTPFQNLKLPDLNDSTTPNMLMQAGSLRKKRRVLLLKSHKVLGRIRQTLSY